jgi:uncharacterized protein YukE
VSQDYWIDTDRVMASAPAFAQLGDRMQEIFSTLKSKVEAEGECWGGDDYGKAFAKDYVPARDSAFDFFPQMSKGLTDIASGLEESADTSGRAESASHQMFET